MKSAVFLVVLVLLAAGCTGSSAQAPQSVKKAKTTAPAGKYTKREVRWLTRLSSWTKTFGSAAGNFEDTYQAVHEGKQNIRALRRAMRPMTNCARNMRTKLGAPSPRLQPAFDLLLKACEQEKLYAIAMVRTFRSDQDQSQALDEAHLKSQDFAERARRKIESGLLANRALPVLGGMSKKSRIEPRFTGIANKLAPKRVQVRCWSSRDWGPTAKEWKRFSGATFDVAGFANPPARANIAPEYCAALARFAYRHWRPSGGNAIYMLSESVGVLAHETEHLVDPHGTEAETECHAQQDLRRVARALGASPQYAARLAKINWEEIYPTRLAEYRTRDCRNGGLLDINPQTNVWP